MEDKLVANQELVDYLEAEEDFATLRRLAQSRASIAPLAAAVLKKHEIDLDEGHMVFPIRRLKYDKTILTYLISEITDDEIKEYITVSHDQKMIYVRVDKVLYVLKVEDLVEGVKLLIRDWKCGCIALPADNINYKKVYPDYCRIHRR